MKMQSQWKNNREDINTDSNNDELYKMTEEVKATLKEEDNILKEGYVPLGKVIDTVSEIRKKKSKDKSWIWKLIPDTYNKVETQERKGKERFIQEHIAKIKRMGNALGKEAFIFDPENLIGMLRRLGKKGLYWNDHGIKIIEELRKVETLENGRIFVNRELYFEIIQLLNQALENEVIEKEDALGNDMFGDENFPYNEVTKYEVEEVFANMDIIISLNDDKELLTATELGKQMLILEFLQREYIYQTVYERYESNSDLSSKTLEKISKDGKEIDTYYNYLFCLIVDICEEKVESGTEGEQISSNELNEIRKEIITACLKERRRYVDTLIRGIENE